MSGRRRRRGVADDTVDAGGVDSAALQGTRVSEADAANLARECAEVGRGLPAGALRAAGPFSFGEGVIPRGVLESETRLDGDHSVVKAAGAYFEKNEKYLENERKKIRVLHGADVDPQAPVSARRGGVLLG